MTILLISTDFTWFQPSLLGLGRLGQDSQDMAKTLRIRPGSLVSVRHVEPSGVQVLKNPNSLKDVEASVVLDVALLV